MYYTKEYSILDKNMEIWGLDVKKKVLKKVKVHVETKLTTDISGIGL